VRLADGRSPSSSTGMSAKRLMDFGQRAIVSVLAGTAVTLLVLNTAAAWDFLGWAQVCSDGLFSGLCTSCKY
jgi:hypothetical protein